MVWYSHLFQNFPQFFVIHTVKGFGIVNKAEVDVSLELSCFFNDPADVGNLISGSSAFSKTSLNIWKFTVHILLKPAWRILSITLLACEMSAILISYRCLKYVFVFAMKNSKLSSLVAVFPSYHKEWRNANSYFSPFFFPSFFFHQVSKIVQLSLLFSQLALYSHSDFQIEH